MDKPEETIKRLENLFHTAFTASSKPFSDFAATVLCLKRLKAENAELKQRIDTAIQVGKSMREEYRKGGDHITADTITEILMELREDNDA